MADLSVKRVLILLACVICIQCSAPPDVSLTAQSYGAITFGMTLEQARQVAQNTAALPSGNDAACRYVQFAAYPGVRFMVENGIVTRADLADSARTAQGVAVGDTETQLAARHPNPVIRPHKYEVRGRYFIYPTPDKKAALVIEIMDEKVTAIRGGLEPAVEYVEGCG